jgi:hypothetical protein
MPTTLEQAVRALYAAEQNVSIASFWDVGWRVRFGDVMNGFTAERTFKAEEFDQIGEWLMETASARAEPAQTHAPSPTGYAGSWRVWGPRIGQDTPSRHDWTCEVVSAADGPFVRIRPHAHEWWNGETWIGTD